MLTLGLILIGLWALAGSAHAYPKGCRLPCLNQKLADIRELHLGERLQAVEHRLTAQDQYISWLEERATRAEAKLAKLSPLQDCFGEVPVTRYGQELGPSGYLFQLERSGVPQTLATTALDVSYPNDPIGAWMLVNACNKEGLTPQSSLLKKASDGR